MKKERITLKAVTLAGRYEFGKWFNHRLVTHYIYKFVDESGKVYVWKTTTYAGIEKTITVNGLKRNSFDGIGKGDVLDIVGTIKGESEYNGEPQTLLERVKILDRSFRAETPEEKKARIEAEKKALEKTQRESLTGGDKIVRMTYKNYKEHYSDCETITGSYKQENQRPAEIEVIVREGREKASGVRGEHFSGYEFVNENGERRVYRAVSAGNAERRVNKEFPESKWTLDKVYNYKVHKIW